MSAVVAALHHSRDRTRSASDAVTISQIMVQIVDDPTSQVVIDTVVDQTFDVSVARVSGRNCGADCGFHSPGNQGGTRGGHIQPLPQNCIQGRLAEQSVDVAVPPIK